MQIGIKAQNACGIQPSQSEAWEFQNGTQKEGGHGERSALVFAGGVRRPVLNNAVTGADVMQQEIAIRMNGLTAQCGRHGKSAFIEPAQFSRVR